MQTFFEISLPLHHDLEVPRPGALVAAFNDEEALAVVARVEPVVRSFDQLPIMYGESVASEKLAFPRRGPGLAISPDDKWVLANSGSQLRLYPMPDFSQPPLHTLPHDELMSRLAGMTNLSAVADPASSTGYKLEPGPFYGWRQLPRWQ